MKVLWKGFKSLLAIYIKKYLAYKRALGRRFDNEEKTLRLLDHYLSEKNIIHIEDVTPQQIEAFLASRPREKARGYNHLLSVIRGLFNWLVLQEVINHSPVLVHSRRVTEQRIPFIFDPLQARRLLEVAKQLPDNSRAQNRGKIYHIIFALLYGLGLRVGEVTRLCIKDIDFNRQLLVILQTKFAKNRFVPFGPKMKKLLQDYLIFCEDRHGPLQSYYPLFSFNNKDPINSCTVSLVFHSLIPKLDLIIPDGVSPPCLHDLRHSFAVRTLLRWYRTGIDPSQRLIHLSTFMGHVDPTSTSVYLTITAELYEEANKRFERFSTSLFREVTP